MSLSSNRLLSHTDNPPNLGADGEGLAGAMGRLFCSGGPLARQPEDLRALQAQLGMASAVVDTLEQGGVLAVEAGTGVGKTWAYLAPLLVGKKKAWLSTATQALQDQLFQRDIPALSDRLGLPVRAAMLKGRSSYACLQRLDMARTGELGSGSSDVGWVSAIEHVHRWASQSLVGDLAELVELDERSPLRPWISSSRDNCLGDACPRLSCCHVIRARRLAMDADWVVINHHLFVASQFEPNDDLPALLPSVDVVVFDEAHRLVELGERAMGLSIGSDELRAVTRELKTLGPLWAKGMQPWAHLALVLEQAVRAVHQLASQSGSASGQSAWAGTSPGALPVVEWHKVRMHVFQALTAAAVALQSVASAAQPLEKLANHVRSLLGNWRLLLQDQPDVTELQEAQQFDVRWLDWGADYSWRVIRSASDASALFAKAMKDQSDSKAWVFTSATLGIDEKLTWFVQGLGLDQGGHVRPLRTLRIPSPFDHARQAALYIPENFPEPADERHHLALAHAVAEWATVLGGRTLILTTSLRACSRVSEALRELLGQRPEAGLKVLAQGEMSRRALLKEFRLAGNASVGAVLVASVSFWEGVDLPGEVLQLLVIDKLPFPSPGDPLTQARMARARAWSQDPFQTCFIDRAALALKQGAGRLIRSSTDEGTLVIADRRLLTQSYGLQLLAALPNMPQLTNGAQMKERLGRLAAAEKTATRASTKVQRSS